MHARIVGDPDVVGDVFKPADLFGNPVGRDWSPVLLAPDQQAKVRGNPHIELHEGADEPEADHAPKSRAPKAKAD